MQAISAPHIDWTSALDGDFSSELAQALRALPLRKLRRLPPPKRVGLPIGHEFRIARRYLAGGSSMLDPSGFSAAYRWLASKETQLLYDGLACRQPLAMEQWQWLLGRHAIDRWLQRGLLTPTIGDLLECRFRLLVVGPHQFVVDHYDKTIPQRVHIGADSLHMMEFLEPRLEDDAGAMLDVGVGSGIQLLAFGRNRKTALGVDINPRAVRVAQFNAMLNGADCCVVEERNVFDPNWRPEPFRLITWNAPFMFYPDDEASQFLDGHGGHLGIGLTLQFLDRVGGLLDHDGVAWLLSSAPLMFDGQNLLSDELARRAPALKLDIDTFVLHKYWDRRRAEFHRAHNIRAFESVMICIRHGAGSFRCHSAGFARRSIDWFRTRMRERRVRA